MGSSRILLALLIILTTHFVKTSSMATRFHTSEGERIADLMRSKKQASSESCTTRYSCIDCSTARVCAPLAGDKGFQEVQQVKCTGNTPFCDHETGTCTSTQSLGCAFEDEFICLNDGYYPDQSACSKFHFCHNSTSSTFICTKNNYHYDSKSESCVYGIDCYGFDCDNRNGQKVKYAANSSIYAYCVENRALIVDRCLGEDQLNETSQKCEPVCVREGLMEDSGDCKSFYKCSIENSGGHRMFVTYTITHHSCPEDHAYSATDFQCVPIEQVSNCQREREEAPDSLLSILNKIKTENQSKDFFY